MGRCAVYLCLFLFMFIAILPFHVIRAKKLKGCLKQLGLRSCGVPIGKRTENQDAGPPDDYLRLWEEYEKQNEVSRGVLDRTVSLLPKHAQMRVYKMIAEMVIKLAESDGV